MKKTLLVSVLSILLVSSGCKKNSVIRSFCFWKTSSYFSQSEDSLSHAMQLQHLYVRFFDVDWNSYKQEPQPIATIRDVDYRMRNLQITPSIFVSNSVLLQSDRIQLDSLALRIQKRTATILDNYKKAQAQEIAYKIVDDNYQKQTGNYRKRLNLDSVATLELSKVKLNCNEILIDCDWSEKSKKNYFYLLKKIKNQFPGYSIAATIRLWQYKYYKKTGIPPVDKGLLMCYNLTSPTDYKTENSIGTSKEVEQYLTHNDYQLKLDLALPLYSWSVVFRGNEFKGILSDYDDFVRNTTKFKKITENRYLLQDDILVGDNYLRNGDEIRIEKISDAEIKKIISILKDKITITDQTKVTFFSFDKKYINDYGIQNISNYYSLF
jgi:hypothetical protein